MSYVLRVVMENRWESRLVLQHENQSVPYTKRLVTLTLTPEQEEAIRPRRIGTEGGREVFEDIREAWIESEYPALAQDGRKS